MSESSTQTPEQGRSGAGKAQPKKLGLWARFTLFMRQMVAELRKVIWPTRKELITYTWVVIIFVTVFTLIVAGFDFVFAKLVLAVFGN